MIRTLLLGRIEWTDEHQGLMLVGLAVSVLAGAALLVVLP